MKKLIYCLLAVVAIALVSCHKDKSEKDYAKDWEGMYDLHATLTLNDVPVVGSITRDFDGEGRITSVGDNNVIVTVSEYSVMGHASKEGLHVDTISMDIPIENIGTIKVKAITDVVPPLENGRTTGEARLSASYMTFALRGTAEIEARKK